MLPDCLKLNSKQREAANEFMSQFPAVDDCEADCCMTSKFTFTVVASGIGDSIWLHGPRGAKIYLDDGLVA